MTEKLKFKCTVLGANGYLGRHMIYILSERGYAVFAYDIDENRNRNIPEKVIYKKVDITQKEDVGQINFDVDFLFFFAGITGTKEGFDHFEKFIRVNELGLLNILTSIRELQLKPMVIFPSTRLVYKGSVNPLKEDAEKETKTIYAANKLAGENLLNAYWNAFNIPFLIFRICVPYGNLFDDNFSFGTIGYFLRRAKNKENIILYGDGSLKRTFTHIVSVCDQIVKAVSCRKIVNDVFNVNGDTYSLKDIAEMLANKYGVSIKYSPWPKEDLLIESGDTVFNAAKLSGIIEMEEKNIFKDWVASL
jgi:UDP-glucose 4-epimerase